MHDAFVALSVANDLLDRVKPSLLHRLATQYLMSAANENRVSHFWASRNTRYLHLGFFLWKQYIILASYKDLCKLQSFWLCTPLVTLAWSFFSGTYLLKLSSSHTFATRWSISVVIVFLFLGTGFANIPPTFLFQVKFKQGIQKH